MTATSISRTLYAAAAALGITLLQPTASGLAAQEPYQAPNLDDETLEQFAEAYLDLQEINAKLERELSAVQGDVERAQRVQARYGEEISEAVKDHGLEPAEYRQIFNAVNTDPQLRARFRTVLAQVQEQREGKP